MRALTRMLPSPKGEPGAPIDWDSRPWRVLFVRTEKVGDLLLVTGVIRAIAQSHPTITVDVLAADDNEPVLRGNPYVCRTHIFYKKLGSTYPALWKRLRRERYDVVVDGRINPARLSAIAPLLLLMTGARYRIGARVEGKEALYTHHVAVNRALHFAEQSAAVARPFGVDPSTIDLRPMIFLSEAEREWAAAAWQGAAGGATGPRLLVNVSALGRLRRWPAERYVEVLRRVRERRPDVAIAVIGDPREFDQPRAIADAAGVTYVKTTLREAFALVERADLVYTPDTAISHVASAFVRPVVVMMTSRADAPEDYPADCWAPWRTPARFVRSSTPSLDAIPVDRVLDAVLGALEEFCGARAGRDGAP